MANDLGEVNETIPMSKQEMKEEKKREAKEKKELKKAQKAQKKGKKGLFIFLSIVILLLFCLYGLMYFDAFGLRSNYMSGFLAKVPAIEKLFPPLSPDAAKTKSDLVSESDSLKAQITQLEAQLKEEQAKSEDYAKQIAALTPLQNEQTAFQQQKADFDKMVAEGDPEAYSKYYASIYPTNADTLYKEIMVQKISVEQLNNYVAMYSSMDASSAAAILTQMVYTDLDIVVLILSNMDTDKSGAILAAMDPADAATVSKRMVPKNTPAPVATKVPLPSALPSTIPLPSPTP